MKYRIAIYRDGVRSGYVCEQVNATSFKEFEADNLVAATATRDFMQHHADSMLEYRRSKGWPEDPVVRYEAEQVGGV